MKTYTKGHITAEYFDGKIIVEDNSKNISRVYEYPFHQTVESALTHCIWKYEQESV